MNSTTARAICHGEIRGPLETDYNVPHWPRIFVIDAKGLIRRVMRKESWVR